MQTELRIPHDKPLAEALADALGAMLDEAKAQARRAVEAPGPALHDYRRAIRRAQALISLTAPMLRKRQRKQLAEELTRATRRTRTLRDLDAVLPVLDKLDTLGAEGDEAAGLVALRRYLEAAGDELAGSEITAWRLRKNVRSIAGLGEVFAAGLHGWVELDMLRDSLRDQYRTTRDAWKLARDHERVDDIHAWRKAARGLRYQLEALCSRAPNDAGLAHLHETFASQVKALGQVTDLFALIAIVKDADQESLGADADALAKWLGGLAEARAGAALADAEEVFALKPKSFAWPTESTTPDAVSGPASDTPEAEPKSDAVDAEPKDDAVEPEPPQPDTNGEPPTAMFNAEGGPSD